MKHLIGWAQSLTMAAGGPGLFLVAFLDSSVLSLPEINDLLVVWLVMRHKERLLYYALMATLGSIVGCFVVYFIGRTGGDAVMRRRMSAGRMERAMATLRRYGLLAVLVPALLPPPAPFKIFVLLAGAARVRLSSFTLAIAIGRGVRYIVEGLLAVWYGEMAIRYLKENTRGVAIVVSGVVLLGGLLYIWWSRRSTGDEALDPGP